MSDLYGVFEKNPNITESDVRKIYLRLVKKYHPDLHGDNPAKYTLITKDLNNQYSEILKRIRLRNQSGGKDFQGGMHGKTKEQQTSSTYNSSDAYVQRAKFRDVSYHSHYEYNKGHYKTVSQSNSYSEIINRYKDEFFIIPNNKNSYLFISKDYGIKKFKNEKVQKHKVLYMEKGDKKNSIDLHDIYGSIDLKKLETDGNYKDYIVNELLTKEKLKSVSEKLYGYIGTSIQKGNKYEQQCNVDILQILKEKSENERFYFQRNDMSRFSLRCLYKKIVDFKELDVYAYEEYDKNGEVKNRNTIISNINIDRLEINKKYREMVLNKYLNNEWIKKCIQKSEGYIGNPEEEYKVAKENGKER